MNKSLNRLFIDPGVHEKYANVLLQHPYDEESYTPGSMNSLFSDFFREFWRGILGGVRDYLGEVLGGF